MSAPPAIATIGFEDAAALGDVLGDAFRDDPILSWIAREDAARDAALTAFFRMLTDELGPRAVMQMTECGRAGALWLPPGATRDISAIREITVLPVLLRLTGGIARFLRILRLRAAVARTHPKAPHWYLFFLGARRGARGQGLGSALLKHQLARVDADGAAVFLEASSEDNRRLYARFGFEAAAPSLSEPGAPPFWPMWRPARR